MTRRAFFLRVAAAALAAVACVAGCHEAPQIGRCWDVDRFEVGGEVGRPLAVWRGPC